MVSCGPVVPMQHLNENILQTICIWACTAALNTWVCSIDLQESVYIVIEPG